MPLEMWPEHRHPIPEVAIGRSRPGLGHCVGAELQVDIGSGLSRPVRIATAIGIAGFGETSPIADYPSLNCQVGICWTIAPLPREQERMLKGVNCAERLQMRIVLERVIEYVPKDRLSLGLR